MENQTDESGETVSRTTDAPSPTLIRQCLRYVIHVSLIYLIVNTLIQWLSGQVHGSVLPLLEHHSPTVSGFQFLFSHLLALSAAPAFVFAFVISQRYRHQVALFAWVVPAVVLIYKLATFHSGSVLSNGLPAAVHQYLGGGFQIEEFHSWKELFEIAASNPDMARGMQQLRFTAPFYASIGYCLGVLISLRLPIPKLQRELGKIEPGFFNSRRPKTSD